MNKQSRTPRPTLFWVNGTLDSIWILRKSFIGYEVWNTKRNYGYSAGFRLQAGKKFLLKWSTDNILREGPPPAPIYRTPTEQPPTGRSQQ